MYDIYVDLVDAKTKNIPYEEGNMIITRKISRDSSSSRVNGRAVTLSDLKDITSVLVDIYGQHDHQSLLDPSKHLDIVDEYGAQSISPAKAAFNKSYSQYRTLRSRIKGFSQSPEELSKEISFLEYQINEIDSADLRAGEDTTLEAEYRKLSNASRITSGLQKIHSELSSVPGNILDTISDSLKDISVLADIRQDISSLKDQLMDIDSLVRDLNHDMAQYINNNSFDARRYDEVHDRLDLINNLKSKYGKTISEILDYRNSCSSKLEQLNTYLKNKEGLQSQMAEIKQQVRQKASQLSNLRKEAASLLEENISRNLKDLNFLNVDFSIDFSMADRIYENGYDRVQFMISTNVGEPRKPLAKVASGGELSRIMLAIKASIADADRTQTLIFDEIDTGISGRTAQSVAEKLAFLARSHQIICITHLPQIAAMADTHFAIEKSVEDGSTISGIRLLSAQDSVSELARLLSGSEITPAALRSAAEMKAAARNL